MKSDRRIIIDLRNWVENRLKLVTAAREESRVDFVRWQLDGELRALRQIRNFMERGGTKCAE